MRKESRVQCIQYRLGVWGASTRSLHGKHFRTQMSIKWNSRPPQNNLYAAKLWSSEKSCNKKVYIAVTWASRISPPWSLLVKYRLGWKAIIMSLLCKHEKSIWKLAVNISPRRGSKAAGARYWKSPGQSLASCFPRRSPHLCLSLTPRQQKSAVKFEKEGGSLCCVWNYFWNCLLALHCAPQAGNMIRKWNKTSEIYFSIYHGFHWPAQHICDDWSRGCEVSRLRNIWH